MHLFLLFRSGCATIEFLYFFERVGVTASWSSNPGAIVTYSARAGASNRKSGLGARVRLRRRLRLRSQSPPPSHEKQPAKREQGAAIGLSSISAPNAVEKNRL